MNNTKLIDKAYEVYRRYRIELWDSIASKLDRWSYFDRFYHHLLTGMFKFLVSPGQKILEIGCGHGDLLASLSPSRGVGIDISSGMIEVAKSRHPRLEFIQSDIYDLDLDKKFDVIIMSDLVNELWDVQMALEITRKFATPDTRLIINFYSKLWEIPLTLARKLKLAAPLLHQNWLTVDDVNNMLTLANYDMIRSKQEIMLIINIPFLEKVFNKFLVKLWPFRYLALTSCVVARPLPETSEKLGAPKVSVVVPARNESDNIKSIFERVPEMGSEVELIFVEGHSKDDTYEAIKKEIEANPEINCLLLRQSGVGKGNAVRDGFNAATGDVLMILDADLTVPPEDLPKFLEALTSGKGEFINGVRLVYPLENEAMRHFNLLGNKFFSMAFSWLLEQSIKDTLCGTKVLTRRNYEKIASNRTYFGDFDPFGDFDLLFGAAKLNLKIVDMPIRYRARTYGETNIDRWRHGWLLIRMVFFAIRRLKFV